jgi:hypothetical protein
MDKEAVARKIADEWLRTHMPTIGYSRKTHEPTEKGRSNPLYKNNLGWALKCLEHGYEEAECYQLLQEYKAKHGSCQHIMRALPVPRRPKALKVPKNAAHPDLQGLETIEPQKLMKTLLLRTGIVTREDTTQPLKVELVLDREAPRFYRLAEIYDPDQLLYAAEVIRERRQKLRTLSQLVDAMDQASARIQQKRALVTLVDKTYKEEDN